MITGSHFSPALARGAYCVSLDAHHRAALCDECFQRAWRSRRALGAGRPGLVVRGVA
jgi:hypothetical protein